MADALDGTASDPARHPTDYARHEARSAATKSRQQTLTDRAGEQHDALTRAIERLERALAEAGVHRERAWSARVASVLEDVRHMIRAHTLDVESSEGLFKEIESEAPRLAQRVDQLRKEHASLASRAGALADLLRVQGGLDVVGLRAHASGILADLRGHRAAEADLVYEAFWMEFGAPD